MDSDHYCLSTPTKEIRLFDLLSPTTPSDLRGRIRRATIGHTPPFVAVSHVWGDGKFEKRIQLDSGCGTKHVQISQNLESLFTRLLDHNSTTLPQFWQGCVRLPMWIDMICINQTDAGEKALQIPLMRDIYSQAQSVIIWINEDDDRLRHAFHYFLQIAVCVPAEDSNCSALFDLEGWEALKHLLDCEWFHRRWVIQEAVTPQKAVVLCGPEVMTMDDLFSYIDIAVSVLFARPREAKILNNAHSGSVRSALAIRELKKSYTKSKQQLSLLWLLEHLRLTRATLAHDQIYALLGLCSPGEVSANPIRYDLEPEEIYKTFALSHARLYNDLEFLGLCTPAQRDMLYTGPLEELKSRPFSGPSWVPNWHSKRLQRCLGLNTFDQEQNFFNASAAMPVNMLFNGNELSVSGIRVGRIRTLGDFCPSDRRSELSDPNSKLFQQYFDFWMAPSGGPMPYKDRKCRAEAFARTISLLGIYRDPVPSPSDVPDMFSRWCDNSSLGKQLAEHGLRPTDVGDGPKETFVRMKRLMSWEPFITELGYIGLSHQGSFIGDEIWVVGGCNVPLLLSPQAEDPSHYQVKGEVFIDGFMFGEITGMESTEDRSTRRLILV